MSEEIKEILDQLKDSIEYPKFEMPTFDGSDFDYVDNDTFLEPDKCKILLDYITYLQQKENIIKEVREYIKYQLENLDFEKDIKAKMLGAMVLVMLDKDITKKSDCNYEKVEKENK